MNTIDKKVAEHIKSRFHDFDMKCFYRFRYGKVFFKVQHRGEVDWVLWVIHNQGFPKARITSGGFMAGSWVTVASA